MRVRLIYGSASLAFNDYQLTGSCCTVDYSEIAIYIDGIARFEGVTSKLVHAQSPGWDACLRSFSFLVMGAAFIEEGLKASTTHDFVFKGVKGC